MKKHQRSHESPPATELPRAACEICGAPYKLVQSHDWTWGAKPGSGYGAYKQTCKCERPAPPKRDYGPDVPF